MELTQEDLNVIKLFYSVDAKNFLGLLKSCPVIDLGAEEVLFQSGDDSKCMYIVLEGEVSVLLESLKKETVLTMVRGDSVGELSLLDGRPRSAYVAATMPSRLLEINRDIFWTLINGSHGVAVNLLIMLSARLRGNNDIVVESIKEQQKHRTQAFFDGLTGLHNRRWLNEFLPRQMTRAQRSNEALTIAMIDIDHFKGVNDTYGHQAGDFVLVAVANCLRAGIRPIDFSARYGGEEFTIVFPQTSVEYAAVAAERIRKSVGSLELVMPVGGELSSVTISMGVAEMGNSTSTIEALVDAADRALYRAKDEGRNKVCLAPAG